MSDISIFFRPLGNDFPTRFATGTMGSTVSFHTGESEWPALEKGTMVILGCPEVRRSGSGLTEDGLARIRTSFYGLENHFPVLRIIDLGNILPGDSVEDTYFALTAAVTEIVKAKATVVILGGGQDLTYANYLAYQKLEQVVNMVTIDSRFDLGDVEDDITSECYLQKIVLHQPNILFNFSNLAYQTYHVHPRQTELMHRMFFDTYRLGEIQSRIEESEPVIRTADMGSFDLTAIRTSDSPANHRNEPNGLYGEEACALCRYAGLSDKMSSFGLYEYDEKADADGRSAALIGQMLWYFAWGMANRKGDYPFADREENIKYTVTIEEGRYDIVFYKSPRSDRWWMEVPYPSKRGQQYERHFMVPCSYSDYTLACANEMPDRWWQTYQKLG
ncbi:MAG: formimidoylglutamase [Flavobacteriales bacterium]|nr:formimidoylglutamase [Flavobacteriales bacterium]